jgi:hypothetical protein
MYLIAYLGMDWSVELHDDLVPEFTSWLKLSAMSCWSRLGCWRNSDRSLDDPAWIH